MAAANMSQNGTFGFCIGHNEDGVVLYAGVYATIFVPSELCGNRVFPEYKWYGVEVKEEEHPYGGNLVATSQPFEVADKFKVLAYPNDANTMMARKIPVFIGHRCPGDRWIGMNGFLGKVLIEQSGLVQFRTYLFDLIYAPNNEFSCGWKSVRLVGTPTVSTNAKLVTATHQKTEAPDNWLFVDQEGVVIDVHKTDVVSLTYVDETTQLKIVRGAHPLKFGFVSECCFATPDLSFSASGLEDIRPQFQEDNDAASTVPEDPHMASEPEDPSDDLGDVAALKEWVHRALALVVETAGNPATASVVTDAMLERLTNVLVIQEASDLLV